MSLSKGRTTLCVTSYRGRKRPRQPLWTPRRITSDYKSTLSGSAFRNNILSKVVDNVKSAYMDGEDMIYTFDDLLKKAKLTKLSEPVKEWLRSEALPKCERIKGVKYIDGVTRYEYNPPLPCRNEARLIEFLKGKMGEGVPKEDILLSVPNADRVLEMLQDQVCIFTRYDKKEVVFYSEKCKLVKPEPWFVNLASKSSVFATNDEKVEDILLQNGFLPARLQALSMEADNGNSDSKQAAPRRRKNAHRRKFKNNDHVQNKLEVYS